MTKLYLSILCCSIICDVVTALGDFELAFNDRRNGNLVFAFAYFYGILLAALLWSIWRFIWAILSLRPKSIKKKVEQRLSQHYAERRLYRATVLKINDNNPTIDDSTKPSLQEEPTTQTSKSRGTFTKKSSSKK